MRNVRLAVVAALLLLPRFPADAGDDAAPPPAATRESALEAGLAALRVRMEARLREVEILRAAGKSDDALRVLREIEQAYAAGLEDLRRLIDGSARSLLPADGSDLFEEHAAYDPVSRERSPFGERGRYRRRRHGTGPPNRTQVAIHEGLRWLTAHQSPDGGWHVDEFDRWCDGKESTDPRPGGKGEAGHDAGVTGLAVAAYLGMGYTWRGDHEYIRPIARAVGFLRAQQRADGGFGPRTTTDWILDDACCALAMVEAYGETGQQSLRHVAQRALDHLASIRTPSGVWGCGWAPGPEDEHTTGWATLPFLSARHINDSSVAEGLTPPLRFDAELLGDVAAWCTRSSDTAGGTFAPRRYQTRADDNPVSILTASAILLALPVLVQTELPVADARARMSAWLAIHAPSWATDATGVNLSAWSFSALAAYRLGGEPEKAWTSAFHLPDSAPTALLSAQEREGTHCAEKGSWDPVDARWAPWGRVGSTALMTFLLESFWDRYPGLQEVPKSR